MAGALRAAGLGTAARGPPWRRRRPHKSKIFEIKIFWAPEILVRNWPERSPNGSRTDPERTPNRLRVEPARTPNRPGANKTWGQFPCMVKPAKHCLPKSQKNRLVTLKKLPSKNKKLLLFLAAAVASPQPQRRWWRHRWRLWEKNWRFWTFRTFSNFFSHLIGKFSAGFGPF